MSKDLCENPCGVVSKKPAFTEDDLQKMLKRQIRFNEKVLKLDHQTAKRWARETIRIIREVDHEAE